MDLTWIITAVTNMFQLTTLMHLMSRFLHPIDLMDIIKTWGVTYVGSDLMSAVGYFSIKLNGGEVMRLHISLRL